MGVKDEDIDKIGQHLSTSAQYHCYGDSIVTTCLMAIFGELLDVEWKDKVEHIYDKQDTLTGRRDCKYKKLIEMYSRPPSAKVKPRCWSTIEKEKKEKGK